MKIVIKTTNIKLTKALEKYIEEKLNSLEKFVKIFQTEKYFDSFFGKGKPRVEAWLEIGKSTFHHQKPSRAKQGEVGDETKSQRPGPYFYTECQMRFPKRSLRATAQREDLKLAIVEVKDELQRQLKQYKEKLTAQTKRRDRALKKELKLSSLARFWRRGRIREEGI